MNHAFAVDSYCSWCHRHTGIRTGFPIPGETNGACIPCAEDVLVDGMPTEVADTMRRQFREALRDFDREFLAVMWAAGSDDLGDYESCEIWRIRTEIEIYRKAYYRWSYLPPIRR